MPYSIRRIDGQYCIVKRDGGKRMGCHKSRGEALRQMAAIYANENKELTHVFKDDAGTRHMLLVTSNGYKDREGEFLSTEALREYVETNWDAATDRYKGSNVLMFWHQGPAIGDIIHADMVGPFLVEVAQERASGLPLVKAYTTAIWNYVEEHPEEAWGTSHGFGFDPADRETTDAGPVYRHIKKFETSVLPLTYAANPLTYSGVIPMATSKARDEKLEKIQPGLGERVRRALGLVTEDLTAAGVEHKSFEAVMTKEDMTDVILAVFNQVLSAAQEVATKADGDGAGEGETAPIDVRTVITDTLDTFMDIPTVSLEAAEGILAIEDDEPEAPAEADGEDAADPIPAPTPEPGEGEKALKAVIGLNEQLVTDQTALIAQQADILAALKSLATLPDVVTVLSEQSRALTAQVKAMQSEFEQRPRASRAQETIAGDSTAAELVGKALQDDWDSFVPREIK